jgi:phosphoribosylformylglycinamidine (FGAM) synthase-like enzyme
LLDLVTSQAGHYRALESVFIVATDKLYAETAVAIDQSALDTIALSRAEYDLIVQKLGREPNEVELGMFGALWSEHCGYKNSKPLLRLLPAEGAYVLTRRGAENAGAIDIGDDIANGFEEPVRVYEVSWRNNPAS